MDEPVTKGHLSLRDLVMDDLMSRSPGMGESDEGQGEGIKALEIVGPRTASTSDRWERLLWKHLRGRHLEGFKFRRQVVIEPYIVDFVCLEAKLIIEADGGQHTERMSYDAKRTARLEAMGYRVIRFWNHEILRELHSVLEQIQLALIEIPSPLGNCSRRCPTSSIPGVEPSPGGTTPGMEEVERSSEPESRGS